MAVVTSIGSWSFFIQQATRMLCKVSHFGRVREAEMPSVHSTHIPHEMEEQRKPVISMFPFTCFLFLLLKQKASSITLSRLANSPHPLLESSAETVPTRRQESSVPPCLSPESSFAMVSWGHRANLGGRCSSFSVFLPRAGVFPHLVP